MIIFSDVISLLFEAIQHQVFIKSFLKIYYFTEFYKEPELAIIFLLL